MAGKKVWNTLLDTDQSLSEGGLRLSSTYKGVVETGLLLLPMSIRHAFDDIPEARRVMAAALAVLNACANTTPRA